MRKQFPQISKQFVAMEGILVIENVDSFIYFQIIENSLQTPGNQGGFLKASSTTSSNENSHWSNFRKMNKCHKQ
jgi:hypothetical protein